MHCTLIIASILFASTLVHSMPTAASDPATLLKNGQEAQQLNALFQTIKISDPCDGGPTTACVGNAISNCVNNTWDTTNGVCSESQQCFAIPNVRSNGTTLTCTSEKSALSIIDASGANGGITGADASGSTNGTNSSASSSSSTTQSSAITPAPTGPDIVTVTVTVIPETTLPITTTTISPQDASSIFSSILAQGQPTSSTVSSSSPTSKNSATLTATTSVPPSTIILLTAAPETSTTTSVPQSSIILLTAAPEPSASAPPPVSVAAANISASSNNSGGYGSGGY